MANNKAGIFIPADVSEQMQDIYIRNYQAITHNTNRLMLFACDQKIEHLNQDFYGPGIHADARNPEHLFRIAQQGKIGALATNLGLVARYGKQYPDINYIIKLNGKTNLIKTEQKDPLSALLWSVDQVIAFQEQTRLNICGIGLTVYLGSQYESEMLSHAAQAIYYAHQYGLVAMVWIYLRGKSITNDQDPDLLAGAAGVATALGSDFVKIKPPLSVPEKSSTEHLKIATAAAGNTKVICAGGKATEPKDFLQELYDQIHIGGTAGSATGRNIFQKSLQEAIAMTNAISAIVYDDASSDEALKIYEQHLQK